jgi:hypothetical protein
VGGAPDKEVGRMIVTVLLQYLEEHPDELVCFSHADNRRSNATNRIYHLWARANRDLFDGKATFFEGTGHNAEGVQEYQPQVHEWHQLHLSEFLSKRGMTQPDNG